MSRDAFTYTSEAEAAHQASLRNRGAPPSNIRHVTDRYPDPYLPRDEWRYGVRKEFRYADRPDLGWINGGFIPARGRG